jgi:hypothetical protein
MSEKVNQSGPVSACLTPIVLFGMDSRGKPKAARFGKQHAGLALKAATQLQLQVLPGNDPKIADLASRLPVGRVHATGRTFVPLVRRDLYDQLVAAAGNGAAHAEPPSHGSSAASNSAPSGSAPRLPKDWQEIGVGDLVVANYSRDEGWYEAVVVQVDGDMLTLRWRDYPRERRFIRHRDRVGLLYPNAEQTLRPAGQARSTTKHQGKGAADESANNGRALPTDWQQIDIGHLVLAKDDGPWRSWWEAVPVEKDGDVLKLRWKDCPNLSLITRGRLDLALLRSAV